MVRLFPADCFLSNNTIYWHQENGGAVRLFPANVLFFFLTRLSIDIKRMEASGQTFSCRFFLTNDTSYWHQENEGKWSDFFLWCFSNDTFNWHQENGGKWSDFFLRCFSFLTTLSVDIRSMEVSGQTFSCKCFVFLSSNATVDIKRMEVSCQTFSCKCFVFLSNNTI